jgi:hypothetical protein
MGVVFQASEPALLRMVAIKFLTPRLAASPVARARFAREGQAAAAVKHPNVVTIYAISEHQGLPYLVMEYVEGGTLADRLKRNGMLERKSILRIGLQIARGLAAAHAQGLVHRDLKPGNILLEGGLDQVKITDFGLACVTTEPWRLTASGVLLGTPAYMSPKQAAFSAVDHRSDLFSLGSVLYELCTGEPPFRGPTLNAILAGVREAKPRPIRYLNPDIPPALEDVIRRLMAKNPAERSQSARELVRVLADELAEIQGRSPRPPFDDQQNGELDPADVWDEEGSFPRPKGHSARMPLAAWALLIARRSAPIVGAAMLIAATAAATIFSLPTSWRDLVILILLLAMAGIAVFTWGLAQLVTAVRRPAETAFAKPRRVGVRRNVLGTAILIAASTVACVEWSAYLQAKRALSEVTAKLDDRNSTSSPNEYDSSLPKQQDVEALIGRPAEDWKPYPGGFEVVYRWRGVFRTYAWRAVYRSAPNNPPNPGAALGQEKLSERLHWVSDVLE